MQDALPAVNAPSCLFLLYILYCQLNTFKAGQYAHTSEKIGLGDNVKLHNFWTKYLGIHILYSMF